jgi:hypothetical protein
VIVVNVPGVPSAEAWLSKHFSLSNAMEDRPSDLPHLLRRVADELEIRRIAAQDLLDVTISSEMREFGPWWSVTVYWSER